MDLSNLNVTQLLEIDNVELYQVKNGHGSIIDKGNLMVLYSQDFDWFLLKINEFNYGLAKNIPVLASRNEEGALATYVFTNPQGYYAIKVAETSSAKDLDIFEQILKQNTQFNYKEGITDEGLPIEVKEGNIQMRRCVSEGSKSQEPAPEGFNAATMVYQGGKTTKKMIVSSAQAVSSGILKIGDYIKNNHLGPQEEMKVDPKTMSRVQMVNSATGILSSVGSFYIRGLTALGNWLANKIEPKFEQKKEDAEQKEEQTTQSKPSGTIGHAAIHSAVSIWGGMVEALDIIREGITETTSSMVTHKYGNDAGQVFRSGIGIATNVGLPGHKLFKKN